MKTSINNKMCVIYFENGIKINKRGIDVFNK